MSIIDPADAEQRRQHDIDVGIVKFNANHPSDGIQYLVSCGHLGHEYPREVARFLYEHRHRLRKPQLGEYLGEGELFQGGFCMKVLEEYVNFMDFSGLEIDVAIRQFLVDIAFPSEAQKIERIVEKFAKRFFLTAPAGQFANSDAVFVLTYSAIMLNSDLHNPNITEDKKMTQDQFLRVNRGINDTGDLPTEYMTAVYERIKAQSLWLRED